MKRRKREQYVGRFLNVWLRESKMSFRGKPVFILHGIVSMCHYFPILQMGKLMHIKCREFASLDRNEDLHI